MLKVSESIQCLFYTFSVLACRFRILNILCEYAMDDAQLSCSDFSEIASPQIHKQGFGSSELLLLSDPPPQPPTQQEHPATQERSEDQSLQKSDEHLPGSEQQMETITKKYAEQLQEETRATKKSLPQEQLLALVRDMSQHAALFNLYYEKQEPKCYASRKNSSISGQKVLMIDDFLNSTVTVKSLRGYIVQVPRNIAQGEDVCEESEEEESDEEICTPLISRRSRGKDTDWGSLLWNSPLQNQIVQKYGSRIKSQRSRKNKPSNKLLKNNKNSGLIEPKVNQVATKDKLVWLLSEDTHWQKSFMKLQKPIQTE